VGVATNVEILRTEFAAAEGRDFARGICRRSGQAWVVCFGRMYRGKRVL
jgi:hypothetical protein